MAFDYGSIDLGLKNPFKLEGLITAIRGGIQTVLGFYLLITAASIVKEDAGQGWILVIFGVYFLYGGFRALGAGIYSRLRYFVGRNHPTSLATNFSKSEKSSAKDEAGFVGYEANELEEMLVGRKNTTFKEPVGFLARLLHSLFPSLLFMPYPIRNISQALFGAWVKIIVALVAYGFVAFVSLAGFSGEIGVLAFPAYSILFMLYLIMIWRSAGLPTSRQAENQIESLGVKMLVKVIAYSLLLPVVTGLSISWLVSTSGSTIEQLQAVVDSFPSFNTFLYIIAIFIIALGSSSLVSFMIYKRLELSNPMVEVSELRENWQESVHPEEIFINLDNLVMANRRYKEVPNRVYRELNPVLTDEQIEGKGGFSGEMIQEIQPKVVNTELDPKFVLARLITLLSGNILFVISMILTLMFAFSIVDIYAFSVLSDLSSMSNLTQSPEMSIQFTNLLMSALHLFLLGYLFSIFARLLTNAARLFFAEIQFQSILVYFKCEGTFTESKISTGTGIHDSTRSENTLVRSSITPWVVVSRIISSTFAATGIKNLEHPRHILEMHKADGELADIRSDIISFLKDRESIASITSERDLGNASQIHQLNQQTRANMQTSERLTQDEDAAGYLAQEVDLQVAKEPT